MKVHRSLTAVSFFLTLCSPLGAETAVWTDGAAGQLLYNCGSGGVYYASDNHSWTQQQTYGPNPCSHEGTVVRDLSNWSTSVYPNGPGIDVVIGSGSPVELATAISIGMLNVGAAGQLNVNGYGTLNVHGGAITNNGLIKLYDVTTGLAILRIHADTSLNGSGTITFASNDDCWIESLSADEVLTIGSAQTLLAPAVAVAGPSSSRIGAALTNNGTITADEGGLLLDTYAKTNNSLIQAINGGNIDISGITIDNTSGTLTAGAASTIKLSATTISGGLLNGPGIIDVLSGDATFDSGTTIAPETTVAVDGYDILTINGTVTNNGTIQLNDVSGDFAYLRINGNTTSTAVAGFSSSRTTTTSSPPPRPPTSSPSVLTRPW